MHPPPTLNVLARLKSTSLEVISFARYTIHLVFENRNRLSVSAPFRFGNDTQIGDAPVCTFPLSESNLIRLLGQCVDEIACDNDGTLDLIFSNRDRIIVYANDPTYEAYTLLIDGQELVV